MPETEEQQTPVGEAVKRTQNGQYTIGTVEAILKAAPLDIKEEVLPIPEWKDEKGNVIAVKVRSFTSSQAARIRKRMYIQKGDRMDINWEAWELAQFEEGVIEPRFSADQARSLHMLSGKGFQRVIQWLDEKSGIKKEEVREAEDAFPQESRPS